MDLKLHNASVVVLSEGSNPKLLSHDFLARNGIVPEDWQIRDIVVTPPFSQILYENGVQFVVEINRLQVRVNNPGLFPWEKDLPAMASKYLEVLPHVTYRGVGINFVYSSETFSENPFGRLLQDGPWLHREGGLSGAALELYYREQQPQFNVKIEKKSTAGPDGGPMPSLVFNVNYHHDFEPRQERERSQYIYTIAQLRNRFLEYAESLPFNH